ncbi:hypothetical protein JOF56_008151 [Kibdelosporangium banguiense]|uniref:Zinc-finger n=1 Tax=Kibdelosporangium banguiense TaxID=1365924 RepID=A0ABS4TTM8_9PSEU|nr:zf-HC2 domain-containing protein [Kibdelosporangium banguiense]MBP2327766.1 hypothetical protein [Kibdelosporangium banguiense]
MSGVHASEQLIERYAAGGSALSPEQEWTIEAHLETCMVCQQRLAQIFAERQPQLGDLLDVVWQDVAATATSTPAPVRSQLKRRLLTWASPSLLPWLAMTALVVLAALGFDIVARTGSAGLPSLVVLLAPVMPLLGVAASWTRRMDPMYELIAGAPRAGLSMVLRRTAAVLVVVIPMLAIAAVLADGSPVLWLLPCLAFTLGTLALGTVIGVARAAGTLALCWAVAVVIPSLLTGAIPVVLHPISFPGWVLAAVVAAVVVHRRAPAYLT